MLGYVPSEPTVLGVGIFVLAYNGLGYNLRHSHIWLRWPGPLVYMFGSPAHHQVHHSYHPTHINKNFAFMFPVWDLLFGTFQVPETNADVKFGLSEREEEEFTSCMELYFVPFRNVARLFVPRHRKGCSARKRIQKAHKPPDSADDQPERHGRFQRLSTGIVPTPRRRNTW